jgi:Phospholipase_D-nuclease N-terminal
MPLRTLLFVICGLAAAPLPSLAQTNPNQPPSQQRQLTAEQQRQRQLQQAQEEQACAVCAGGAAFMVFTVVALIALNIALLVWVARDAKSRGMDSSILWMLLVMFTSVIGLLIYLFSRPQGELIQCSNCKGKRLKVSTSCPHCHHA